MLKSIQKFKIFYKNYISTKTIYIWYICGAIVAKLINLIQCNARKIDKSEYNVSCCLCIESGINGWNIIEYKELYQSAREFLGENFVYKLSIDRNSSYLHQVWRDIKENRPTHYAYSPRTGRQTIFGGMFDAFSLLILFTWYRITPIVFLTDLPVRLWRNQSAVVSASSGIVVTLMLPSLTKDIFPHNRIIGPYIMPLSIKTMEYLRTLKESISLDCFNCNPLFIGSLYEPRITNLKLIKEGLFLKNINFEICGRDLGGARVTDEQYWLKISSADIVVTTADQIANDSSDWNWLPHFIYRYAETLACGSLLIAPKVPGVSRYFEEGIHYVEYTSVDDAIEKINYYIKDVNARKKISNDGRNRICDLVRSRSFWLGIDISLGKNSLT